MSLQLELAANPLPVLLDRSRMREVLAQVVDLAGGVMSRGSTLQVLARIDGTHAVVNFMDVPSGADAPRLGRWFDEVYAHSLRSKHDNDAAARVAECGQIVGEHHGRIYAAPSPLGSLGITLRLPMLRI
jgi:two-component system sensor histidine kinase BaeS